MAPREWSFRDQCLYENAVSHRDDLVWLGEHVFQGCLAQALYQVIESISDTASKLAKVHQALLEDPGFMLDVGASIFPQATKCVDESNPYFTIEDEEDEILTTKALFGAVALEGGFECIVTSLMTEVKSRLEIRVTDSGSRKRSETKSTPNESSPIKAPLPDDDPVYGETIPMAPPLVTTPAMAPATGPALVLPAAPSAPPLESAPSPQQVAPTSSAPLSETAPAIPLAPMLSSPPASPLVSPATAASNAKAAPGAAKLAAQERLRKSKAAGGTLSPDPKENLLINLNSQSLFANPTMTMGLMRAPSKLVVVVSVPRLSMVLTRKLPQGFANVTEDDKVEIEDSILHEAVTYIAELRDKPVKLTKPGWKMIEVPPENTMKMALLNLCRVQGWATPSVKTEVVYSGSSSGKTGYRATDSSGAYTALGLEKLEGYGLSKKQCEKALYRGLLVYHSQTVPESEEEGAITGPLAASPPAKGPLATKVLNDPKGELQRLIQKKGLPLPVYEDICSPRGPSHEPRFTVGCTVKLGDEVLRTQAEGTNRKRASRDAALQILEMLGQRARAPKTEEAEWTMPVASTLDTDAMWQVWESSDVRAAPYARRTRKPSDGGTDGVLPLRQDPGLLDAQQQPSAERIRQICLGELYLPKIHERRQA